MKNYFILTLLSLFSVFYSFATTHTVSNTGDSGSGSLRNSINNSSSGDTIAFASSTNGSYITLTSGEIEVPHSLVIMGNGIDNTLLSGDNNSRIFKVTAGDFELLSLTIREGLASGAGLNGSGGAIICDNNNQNILKNVRFINNNAHNSGAIEFYQANATVSQCIFAGNKADFSGGGIGVNQCNVTIFNSLISGNVAANGGGSGEGGGASVSNGSSLTLVNSTVVNNYAIDFGAGINGNYTVSNSIVWGNFNAMMNNYDQINGSVTSQYSIIQNTILSGTGNIDGNNANNAPQFKAPIPASATPNAGGDYRLKCSSPLIDRGDNLPLASDLVGNPRVIDALNTGTPTVDLGCYENQYTGPEFSQNNYELCINNGPVQLNNTVSLPNGMFSGTGVQNNTFYPSIAGTGTHSIVYSLSNSQGCVRTDTADFTVLAKPSIQLNVTNTSCSGGDGAVDATITSPNSYTVYWSNGSTNEDIQDLNAGVYYITATDNNGCQATKMANVSSDAFTINSTITDVSCHGGSDGNIDITINGTTGPYTVEWLNNGSNAEDATNIVAGTWEVYVEDANGCAVSQVFEVGEPDDITWTETVVEATCGSNDGSAQCLVSGGTAPYNFQWFDDSGSPVGTNSDNLTGITSGEYSVIISDDNGCTKIWNLFVTEVGGPVVNIDTVINAQCTNNGAIDISIASTNGIQSINWNNGATTEDLSGLAPGYYAVEVVDNSGCTGMAGTHVTNSAPEPIEICIVGVDTSTITNKVVWEKPVTTSISHYNIYRETSTAGQYQFVDSVLYANESFFVDTVAYPHIKSWRYKITAVNNCGVESDKSPAHKTIHLVKNLALGGGINLSWDHYEGFSYPTYFVYRHTDVNGWEQIDQIASTASTTLNDVPPSTNQLDYFVSIEPPSVCESTKATSHNASRSNRSSGITGPNGGGNTDGLNIEEVEMADLKLFPNPTTGLINIQWEELQGVAFYDVFDGAGKLVLSTSSNKIYETINLERLERGIYIISITNNDVKQQYRIVKQ